MNIKAWFTVFKRGLYENIQHKIFGQKNQGVTNVLVERLSLQEFIKPTAVESLWVLTSGPIPPNPSELLGTKRMAELLEALKGQFDYVIVDAPPAVAVTDASVLASKVDGICLVLDSGEVRLEMAQKAKDLLTKANGHIVGVILNRVEIEEEHAYYYYYYGSEKKGKLAK